MGIELTTKEIGTQKIYNNSFGEQSVDCDISLPDYCPDIMRILKCTIQTDITNSKIIGDRATADGNAKITVIYSDEKNSICSYRSDYPFSKYAELTSAYDSALLVCTAKTDYVNCRAVSKRRIDIHGVVSIKFKVCGTSCDTLISSASGNGIQLKRKGIDISSSVASACKSFQLSSVEEVGSNMHGIGKVLNCYAAPIVSETKIIKGKLLIKGELAVKTLYSSDTQENETAVLGCSIPFNEIVEAADFNDSCKTDIKMNVIQLSAEPKVDNDGEYRYMNINAEICAHVNAFEDSSVNTITDAYSTQNELDMTYGLYDFKKIECEFSDSFSVRQSLDIASLKPQKIYASVISAPEIKCSFLDKKMEIKGKIPLSLIIIDADGSPVSCEREAEFEYSHSVDTDRTNLECAPNLVISGFACTLNGDGTADFKAEMNISAMVFSTSREKVLSALTVPDEMNKKERKSSLTVYFCSGKESLWDIAKHYNTTVEEIMSENGLTADYLENKTMLMIPVK